MPTEKLDNPVWFSLSETHIDVSMPFQHAKFYDPDYCPFGSFPETDDTAGILHEYAILVNDFYVVGKKPVFSNALVLKKELVCNQMVLDNNIAIHPGIDVDIVELQDRHKDDLFKLVNLVQPGYFKNKTFRLGCYYGIFQDNQLVAIAGERMKMNEFTEVSAVVTHPAYTGKGFAKKLVSHASVVIRSQNKTPYLHVAATNTGAIQLYEKLGFVTRRKISFWNFVKPA